MTGQCSLMAYCMLNKVVSYVRDLVLEYGLASLS